MIIQQERILTYLTCYALSLDLPLVLMLICSPFCFQHGSSLVLGFTTFFLLFAFHFLPVKLLWQNLILGKAHIHKHTPTPWTRRTTSWISEATKNSSKAIDSKTKAYYTYRMTYLAHNREEEYTIHA